ncbi:DUF3592 domain-containing protein [Actinoplanes philippinensis]|uniref:DUF3592 domain-containing protein n=1 Tax=Actinoplanes philippinensis TaxID=35752 RepID=UPI00340EFB50
MAAVENPRLRWTVGVLGIVAGFAMMWLPYQTSLDNDAWARQLRARGAPAQATVHDVGYAARNSSTMYLDYDVAGVPHRAEVGCWQVCHPAGTRVSIWISPDDPADFATDFGVLSGHRGRIQGGIGMVGLVLFVSTVVVALARLSQRRRDRQRRRWQDEQRALRRNKT